MTVVVLAHHDHVVHFIIKPAFGLASDRPPGVDRVFVDSTVEDDVAVCREPLSDLHGVGGVDVIQWPNT